MYRVELKEYYIFEASGREVAFLMYRVELKVFIKLSTSSKLSPGS